MGAERVAVSSGLPRFPLFTGRILSVCCSLMAVNEPPVDPPLPAFTLRARRERETEEGAWTGTDSCCKCQRHRLQRWSLPYSSTRKWNWLLRPCEWKSWALVELNHNILQPFILFHLDFFRIGFLLFITTMTSPLEKLRIPSTDKINGITAQNGTFWDLC